MKAPVIILLGMLGIGLAGCVTVPPKDYTEFRKSRPRSILVLPPGNQTTDIQAPYSLLTTITHPLAELGYYVFPVVMVDHLMKENGLALPDEMQRAPLEKLHEVFGADAVLYVTIEQYGSKYQVIVSNTTVKVRGKLVDARTGVTLWEGQALAQNAGQSGLIEALVTQVMNKLMDEAHMVAAMASYQLLMPPVPGQGFLRGPRHPEAGTDSVAVGLR